MAKRKKSAPTASPHFLVVGAGLSGAVIARRLAEKYRQPVLVIDQRPQIGGNCYDRRIANITVHRFGAHIFHTNNQTVWNFLSHFTHWQPYEHQVQARVAGKLVPLPFNFGTLTALFPPGLASELEKQLLAEFSFGRKISILELQQSLLPPLQQLGQYVYEHIFAYYSRKQWGGDIALLNPEVLSRVPITLDRDLRYFRDRYQGIPAQGYTAMITNLLDHPFIEVKLKTTYAQISKKISPQKTFYTGSIDEFFDYKLGTLQYRSCRFVDELKRQAQFQPVAVVNYPETQDFTRIIEHKHFLNEHTPHTLITYEYPEAFKLGRNERFYPLNDQDNNDLFARYQKLARQQPDVVFFGRLGDYRYYDMDQVIARALEIKI